MEEANADRFVDDFCRINDVCFRQFWTI